MRYYRSWKPAFASTRFGFSCKSFDPLIFVRKPLNLFLKHDSELFTVMIIYHPLMVIAIP